MRRGIHRGGELSLEIPHGKVTKVVDDSELEVEVAEGVKLRVVRSGVSEVRVKGEPVKE